MTDEIDIRNLVKIYMDDTEGEILAVDDLNLSIESGEMIVMVGPSGCGKSTTLRCIAGLEEVTEGQILVGDIDITHEHPRDRGMAMVFQNYALYPHMTAEENIGFGLKMNSDLSKDERKRKVHEVAEMMGIEDLLDKKPGEISGGQQQRVALGRAIVRDPRVFLMDEPLSNLDAKLRTKMRTEIQELQQELGVTTLYVTHNQTEAMTMADRIAVMNDGILQQIAPPIVCYNQPANRFVASFIGSPSMNFFDVEYDRAGGTLENEVLSYRLDEELAAELQADGPSALEFGIRPEHVEIATDGEGGDAILTVSVTEPHGDMTYVYAENEAMNLTISTPNIIPLSEGDRFEVSFPSEYVYLFDRATGERLAGDGEDLSDVERNVDSMLVE